MPPVKKNSNPSAPSSPANPLPVRSSPSALPGTLFCPSSGNTGNTKSTERERAKTAFGEWSFHRAPRRKLRTLSTLRSLCSSPANPLPVCSSPSALPGTLIRPSSGNTGNTKSTGRERAKTAFGEWSFHRVPRRKKNSNPSAPSIPSAPSSPANPLPVRSSPRLCRKVFSGRNLTFLLFML